MLAKRIGSLLAGFYSPYPIRQSTNRTGRGGPCGAPSPARLLRLLVQRERVERVADGNEHVLLSVLHVALGRVGRRPDARMPERRAVGGVEGDEAAAAVAGEEHLAGGRENAAAAAARREFVA